MTESQALELLAKMTSVLTNLQYIIEGLVMVVFALGAMLVLKWWHT